MQSSGANTPREREDMSRFGHSGTRFWRGPGIHKPRMGVWIPGSTLARRRMTGVSRFGITGGAWGRWIRPAAGHCESGRDESSPAMTKERSLVTRCVVPALVAGIHVFVHSPRQHGRPGQRGDDEKRARREAPDDDGEETQSAVLSVAHFAMAYRNCSPRDAGASRWSSH